MKGISRLRPAQPRYTYTWDPQRLFSYLETLPDNLNLLQLSQKVVSLLALITGGRLQTISLIRLSNIREEMDTIQINITDPIKTSGVNNEQPTLHIPSFKEKPCLCVATTLKAYIAATKDIRKKDQDFIFLSAKKPHATAKKQTLSRWVKQMLSSAGIDTSVFKPHSTRHSSTSAALRRGVSLETICRTAGWSEHTATFAKFYNRRLTDRTDFAKALLTMSLNKD
uniref:Tyr recombinase domain-containing protein n=1 Tax=Photinus pyralis TaxID=7054 RepID=A0A1Y1NBJ0_PHOPY